MSQFGAEYDALLGELTGEVQQPSLAQNKLGLLNEKRKDKMLNITPDALAIEEEQAAEQAALNAIPSYDEMMGGVHGTRQDNSNLVDAVQASFYKTGQSFGELGRDIGSGLAGMVGADDTKKYLDDIQFTPEEEVNEYVGYDPTATQEKMKAVGDAYDKGDVFGTLLSGIKAAPNVLADSAGDLAMLATGGAGLFAKGAKAAKTANKALKAEQTTMLNAAKKQVKDANDGEAYKVLEGLTTSVAKRKDLASKIARNKNKAKTLDTLDKVIRLNKSTIGLGAAYTNQQLNERKENNGGESADFLTAATSFAVNTALFGLEFNIIKGIGLKAGKEFVEDLSVGTIKALGKGSTKEFATAIMKNTGKIAGAAGAEAAQEYAQTWTEILTKQAGTEKYGEFLDVLSDEANQREANIAGILGATTGGTLRAAPMAVTAPVKGTAKVAGKVVGKVADVAATKATEASYSLLSVEERAELKEKFEAEDAKIAETNTARQTQIDTIDKATTIEELRALDDTKVNEAINSTISKSKIAPKLIETIDRITGADTLETIAKASAYGRVMVDKMSKADKENPAVLEDVKGKVLEHLKGRLDRSESKILTPERIKSIKNAAIAQYNKDIDVTKASNTFLKGKDISGKVIQNAIDKTKASGQAIIDAVPQEAVDALNTLVKDGKELTEETIEVVVANVKEADKSIARALLDDLISDKPKRATLTGLSKLNLPTLEAIKKSVKSNKKAQRIVDAAIERKKKIRSQFFGDNAVENAKTKANEAKQTAKEAIKKASKIVKDKIKELVGKDVADKISGLKGIVVDSIKDSETLKELKQFVEDMKKEGKELTKDAKDTLDAIEEAITVKAIELEQEAKKKAEAKDKTDTKKDTQETPEANYDFATITNEQLDKLIKEDYNKFLYSLSKPDKTALAKNQSIPKALRGQIFRDLNELLKKEKAETENETSGNVNTLLEDDIIKQVQEGCK